MKKIRNIELKGIYTIDFDDLPSIPNISFEFVKNNEITTRNI